MELFKGQIKDFDITQIPSNDGKNFPTLHKVIHLKKYLIHEGFSYKIRLVYEKNTFYIHNFIV